MKKLVSILAAFFALALSLVAAPRERLSPDSEPSLRLAAIFCDNMVLQRESFVPVWGWAEPGTKVTVNLSWSKEKYTCVANDSGEWMVCFSTPEAGGPYTMTVSGRSKPVPKKATSSREHLGNSVNIAENDVITVKDVMVGEVWICSGQSNMEMPVRGFGVQTVEGGLDAILEAPEYADRIRIFSVKADTSAVLLEDCNSVWKKASFQSVATVSAVAYFFAKGLTKALQVPVGIIESAWGGCRIEPWLPAEDIESALRGKVPDAVVERALTLPNGPSYAPRNAASLYNSRLYPLRQYGARGFLWYQGCANRMDYPHYHLLQQAMVERWREDWGDGRGDMPFIFATIAPYAYNDASAAERPFFVEDQLSSLDIIPNSYAAVTEALGDETVIHPAKKKEVSDQMLLLALENVYGIPTGAGSGFPYPERIEFPSGSSAPEGKVVRSGFAFDICKGEGHPSAVKVSFANAPAGLRAAVHPGTAVKGFEIAGPDGIFVPARAEAAASRTVTVFCPEGIDDPVALRYSFRNYIESDLVSTYGIPVPPFRTDSLPLR